MRILFFQAYQNYIRERHVLRRRQKTKKKKIPEENEKKKEEIPQDIKELGISCGRKCKETGTIGRRQRRADDESA